MRHLCCFDYWLETKVKLPSLKQKAFIYCVYLHGIKYCFSTDIVMCACEISSRDRLVKIFLNVFHHSYKWLHKKVFSNVIQAPPYQSNVIWLLLDCFIENVIYIHNKWELFMMFDDCFVLIYNITHTTIQMYIHICMHVCDIYYK